MEAAAWGFVGTIVGAVVGACASIATTVVSSRQAARLQEEADSLQRMERFRAFQRDTLLSIQDLLLDLMRLIARAYHEDFIAFRETGAWEMARLTEEVSEGGRVAHARLAVLIERVASDSLRESLKSMQSKLVLRAFAKSREEADFAIQTVAEEHRKLMEQLGKVLRSQY